MNKKLIVALGIGLFGVQLGSQVSQADTVAPFLVSTREAEVPDLPTDPELPDEIPDVPTPPTTDDSTSDSGNSGGGAETPDVPVEPELPNPDVPSEPETPPTDSDTGGDTGTTTPPDTGDSSTGGDTGTTTPPDIGDSSTGGNTGTTTPPDTGNSGTGGDTGITTPPDTGNSGTGGNAGTITSPTNGNSSGQTMTPPTTNVGVNSDGTVNQSGNVGQTTPVQTNNVNELTHIPTASTPVEADTGEKIVSVVDGVPYKQTEQGLTPVTANITKLPSGNIAVKGSDGQLKVLPKTGEKETVLGTVLGMGMVALSGIGVWFKKRKRMNEENR
ncbi:LPXTG cell wall anchor domain-containing protein [Enterococcus hirae]|nr:LPXTG cell wall anchor domain-containing protein [Enterococcus hirae]EMF0514769.1 LPXTG cell wall anchor domain-containing protein [Enterococcus hirae]EMF0617711.1 LPXTG cell wall anchor domain-containing protein [Enterococcus hirae]